MSPGFAGRHPSCQTLGIAGRASLRRLEDADFEALCRAGVVDVTGQEGDVSPEGVIDIEPYISAVPPSDLKGLRTLDGLLVELVVRTSGKPYDLVHVMTNKKNVYLVIAVDVEAGSVFGHYMLNLNQKYGFE
jgi:hypothetical protein